MKFCRTSAGLKVWWFFGRLNFGSFCTSVLCKHLFPPFLVSVIETLQFCNKKYTILLFVPVYLINAVTLQHFCAIWNAFLVSKWRPRVGKFRLFVSFSLFFFFYNQEILVVHVFGKLCFSSLNDLVSLIMWSFLRILRPRICYSSPGSSLGALSSKFPFPISQSELPRRICVISKRKS